MKINFTAIALMLAVASCSPAPAYAASSMTVMYPAKACSEIVSSEYSTGGGDKVIQYLEIMCKDSDGKYTTFVSSWGSAAGLFGFGRWTAPSRFDYKPWDNNYMEVK